MVRTRAKKNAQKSTYVIALDSKTEVFWKDLKEKFKFDSDENFLAFLLAIAKHEYSWSR